MACLGPGYCLPRAFLAASEALDVPDLCHDELRLPLIAQLLGFPLFDTGFYPKWWDPEVEECFRADGAEIETAAIEREMARLGGRRVFHPCRRPLREHLLRRLLETGESRHVP